MGSFVVLWRQWTTEERMIEWTGWPCRWSVYQQFTGFPLLFCINDISHLCSCENKSVVTKSSLHIIFTLNFEELLNFKWFQLPQSSLYVIIVNKSIVSKGDWAVHKRCQNGLMRLLKIHFQWVAFGRLNSGNRRWNGKIYLAWIILKFILWSPKFGRHWFRSSDNLSWNR